MKSSNRAFAPATPRWLRLLYRVLRVVIYRSTRLYFRRITVIGREHLQFGGPAILLSNHPNTLLDPYLAGAESYSLLNFLANASLWKTLPGRLFFGTFCIPVARRKDKGIPGIDNDESFAAASAHLRRGGTLYIAPEGTSELERRVRPVKTGTARIVLQTLRDANFELPLRLAFVGLTYSDPTRFRSQMWLHAAPVAVPKVSAEAYRDNYPGLVQEITEKIQAQLEALTLVTRDDTEDTLLQRLETLLRHQQPLDGPGEFYRSRDLLAGLQGWSVTAFEQLRLDVDAYYAQLEVHGLSDRIYAAGYRLSVLGLPIYLYGYLNNVLPAAVVDAVAHGIVADDSYRSTARWFGGLVLLPVLYSLQTWIVQAVFGQWWLSLLYLIALVPSGLFAFHYHERLGVLAERYRYRRLPAARRAALDELRRNILSRIAPLLGESPAR